ncbi:MAG: hypothetical protein A6F72_08760, partial [Cycloclasticus sp. symbiont of Poecilosclerida sp. N]
EKLITIQQWGSASWSSMEGAFHGASAMTMSASDAPDLTAVSSMSNMFRAATTFNGNIGNWNVGMVTNMESMFNGASLFNQDIGGWDVSSLTNMQRMFSGATDFNQNLGRWYIVPTITLTTIILDTQNTLLTKHNPSYTLVAGVANNDLFRLNGLKIIPINLNQAPGIYSLRVGASGSLFATNNTRNLTINFKTPTSSADFVTHWRIPAGDAAARTLTVNAHGDYTINWGDGNPTEGTKDDSTHIYSTAGDYRVTISNTIKGFYNADKLIDIAQWGTANWERLIFNGASMMRMSATDMPDLSRVTSMARMFEGTTLFNGASIGGWDVSNVRDMTIMFADTSAFNVDISRWNVSRVVNMTGMFRGASAFNQDIGRWNVGRVTNMNSMFYNAPAFNQDINDWNVAGVTTMQDIFFGATAFKQNLGRWYIVPTTILATIDLDTQNTVLTAHSPIYRLIAGAGDNNLFRVSGSTLIPIDLSQASGTYNLRVTASGQALFGTNNVAMLSITLNKPATSMDFVTEWQIPADDLTLTFPSEGSYTINWGDGIIQDIKDRFPTHTYAAPGDYRVIASRHITRFNLNDGEDKEKLINIQQWGSASWSSMEATFWGAKNMRMSASDAPDLTGVSNMQSMFRGATIFNGNIGGWDVSNVEDMSHMFRSTTAFDQSISDWDVSKVTNMFDMFYRAKAFNQDISRWDVSKVTLMFAMFTDAAAFNQNLGRWYIVDTTVATITTLTTQNTMLRDQNPAYSLVTGTGDDHNSLFSLSGSTLTPFSSNQAYGTYNVRVAANGAVFDTLFGTANERSLSIEITNPVALTDFVTQWQMPVGDATARTLTFPGEGIYTINWGDGSAIEAITSNNPTHTYADPGHYQVVASNTIARFNLNNSEDKEKLINIRQWGAASWTSLENAFYGASNMMMSATDKPDLTRVTSLKSMFQDATTFNGDIRDWKVSSVTNMAAMFANARAFKQEIGSWDVGMVTNMNSMFLGASSFNQDISGWDVRNVKNMNYMFAFTTFSQNLGRWYIVDTPIATTTLSTITLTTQNPVLTAHSPMYTLATRTKDNDLFRIVGSTLIPADPNQAYGTYDVRVAASGSLFGTANARTLSIEITYPVTLMDFVTEWQIPTGNNAARTLTFPSEGNYTISWGDGTVETITANNPTHTYVNAGDYTVIASKTITRFNLNNGEDKEKLINIRQWGSANWSSMQGAFWGASSLSMMTASDKPVLSGLTSLESMFRDAAIFNGDIGGWDVSKVTDMSSMFYNASAFNQNINGWDVSKVTDMGDMFFNNSPFNQAISASTFNQDISDWDVSKVTDMGYMFSGASVFNRDIGGWDVSKVTDMGRMFEFASAFNQDLGRWYIVPTTTLITTVLATQNDILTAQTPTYALVTGTGSTHNNLFSLSGPTLTPKDSNIAVGTYDVRIAASGSLFGTNNARSLSIKIGDARLNALALSAGTLDPVFDSARLAYSASVANTVTSLTVTPTTFDTAASVTVNGVTVISGKASTNIFLTADTTTITLVVTTTDITITKVYTIIVTRAADPDPDSFITQWRIPAGDATARTLTFPSEGLYNINWGDGSATEAIKSNNPTHTYADAGDYKVIASNAITRFNLNDGEDKEKLREIQQWGNASWSSMQGAFYGASNMTMSASDMPDLTGVSNMENIFRDAALFNGNIGRWDVSNVEDMSHMFRYATAFDQSIGGWNVSNVEDMSHMFQGTTAFDQSIGGWDVSRVTNMGGMFLDATAFNQGMSIWDVSKVTNMSRMFLGASVFNGAIDRWDVSSVTDMFEMFYDAPAFNQNLALWYIVGTTASNGLTLTTRNDVLAAHSPMYTLATGTKDNDLFRISGSTVIPINPNQPFGAYEVHVAANGALFGTANARNLLIDIAATPADFITQWRFDTDNDTLTFPGRGNYKINWGDGSPSENVRGATDHTYTTAGNYQVVVSNTITRFNLNNGEDKEKLRDVQQWGDASWTSMKTAFWGAKNMRMSASDAPDLTGVSNMQSMFLGATIFNGNIGGWDVSSVTNMRSMFSLAKAFNQDIGDWDVSKVTNMFNMFTFATTFHQNIGGWDVSSVTDMRGMFSHTKAFNSNISRWDVSKVRNMFNMFIATTAFNQNLGRWYIVPTSFSRPPPC